MRRAPAAPIAPARAWVRLPSGRRLDLLAPTPFDWTDEDLAIGLSRTYRWGGHSIWPGAALSVAQHSLTVLSLRRASARTGLSAGIALRELLHDAEEGLINFDCISPLKPFLGPAFAELQLRLTEAVARRYALPAWTPPAWRAHKACDSAAAASEAVFVAGWTRAEIRDVLGITAPVGETDPLAARYGDEPWRPWPPEIACARFLAELQRLLAEFGGLTNSRSPRASIPRPRCGLLSRKAEFDRVLSHNSLVNPAQSAIEMDARRHRSASADVFPIRFDPLLAEGHRRYMTRSIVVDFPRDPSERQVLALATEIVALETQAESLAKPYWEGAAEPDSVTAELERLAVRTARLRSTLAALPCETLAGWRAKATVVQAHWGGAPIADGEVAWSLVQDLLRLPPPESPRD